MIYKLEVVETNLEKVLVSRLSGDHGSVALPLFSREGGDLSGAPPPMSGAWVPMASLK
jgi:hypothetical protein